MNRKTWVAGAVIAGLMLPVLSASAAETVKYTYDAKGRLVKVERSGTANNGVATEYQHDKADNRKKAKTTGSPNSPPP